MNKLFLSVGPTQFLYESDLIGSSVSAFVCGIGPIWGEEERHRTVFPFNYRLQVNF